MARYTVLEKTFINNRLCERGEVVDYDGQPGSTLQPMETRPQVDIPDNWREENGLKRIALARSLGAPKQRMSAADADLWISNELAHREARDAEKKASPAPRPASASLNITPAGAATPVQAPQPKTVPSTSPNEPPHTT